MTKHTCADPKIGKVSCRECWSEVEAGRRAYIGGVRALPSWDVRVPLKRIGDTLYPRDHKEHQ